MYVNYTGRECVITSRLEYVAKFVTIDAPIRKLITFWCLSAFSFFFRMLSTLLPHLGRGYKYSENNKYRVL